jgi:hypothetical protein
MITLKFPKLEKALMKADKDWSNDNPRLGIIILQQNAIVLNHNFMLVVDLYDYFVDDCDITDENEIKELKRILFFMNGKIFNKQFWEELTKGANMRMKEGALFIESPRYAKDLHYKEMQVDFLDPLERLEEVNAQDQGVLSVVSLPFAAFLSIGDTLKTDLKLDHIILEFSDQTRPVKFTFRNRKHFYGYIIPDYDSAQEGFRFENLQYFMKDEVIREMIADLRAQKTPPPPAIEKNETEKIPENQQDMFGGDINASGARFVPLENFNLEDDE